MASTVASDSQRPAPTPCARRPPGDDHVPVR